MNTSTTRQAVTVGDGAVPVYVSEHTDPASAPGVVVVPSIYGPADDLLDRMAELSGATTVVLDPFWRVGDGAVDYHDRDTAIGRLADFDPRRSMGDVRSVAEWTAERTNGNVVGVGICFGGPFVVQGAARGWLSAATTWHGSRIQDLVDDLPDFSAPLRLHFGSADGVVPLDALDKIRAHFAGHPDCEIFVHDGADHGFSFEGPAYDPTAADACYASLRELIGTMTGAGSMTWSS